MAHLDEVAAKSLETAAFIANGAADAARRGDHAQAAFLMKGMLLHLNRAWKAMGHAEQEPPPWPKPTQLALPEAP